MKYESEVTKIHLNYNFSTLDQEEYEVDLYSEDSKHFSGKISNLSNDEELEIWIETDNDGVSSEFVTGFNNEIDKKDFIDFFLNQYNEKKHEIESCELNGISYENDDEKENEKHKPYNVNLIRVDTKQFSVESIFSKIEKGNINLSPDFQRHNVWTAKQKSRFIESLLLNIPVPVFYLAQNADAKYDVVDGLQRLTTIHQFMNNKFKLRDLQYLGKSCEGKYFSSDKSITGNRIQRAEKDCLEYKYINRIEDIQIMAHVIDSQTPPKAKYDIFNRVNTGGTKLNSQEIRNCFASTRSRKLLNSICQSREFLDATDRSVSSKRMDDHELILRFIGFYMFKHMNKGVEYKGDMKNYLNSVISNIDLLDDGKVGLIDEVARKALKSSFSIFGKYAFRRYDKEEDLYGRKKILNRSLFTGFTLAFSEHECVENIDVSPEDNVKKFIKYLNEDEHYRKCISEATNDKPKLEYVIEKTELFINQIVEEINDKKTENGKF